MIHHHGRILAWLVLSLQNKIWIQVRAAIQVSIFPSVVGQQQIVAQFLLCGHRRERMYFVFRRYVLENLLFEGYLFSFWQSILPN